MPARRPKLGLVSTDFAEEEQIGLVLPNGRIVWPPNDYKGRPLGNQEDRAVMLSILRSSAAELDFDEEEFLGQYRWATRHVEPHDVFPITHDEFVVVADQPVEVEEKAVTNGQH